MDVSGLIVQLLNGLAGASSLFLVAAGLSLIFGVTRIVNFAHGSFFMLGIYLAYSLVEHLGRKLGLAWSFWLLLLLAAVISGVLGALVEIVLLRRIYKAPELFQLLATFALVLVIKDAALWVWGPEDLLGPRPEQIFRTPDPQGSIFDHQHQRKGGEQLEQLRRFVNAPQQHNFDQRPQDAGNHRCQQQQQPETPGQAQLAPQVFDQGISQVNAQHEK